MCRLPDLWILAGMVLACRFVTMMTVLWVLAKDAGRDGRRGLVSTSQTMEIV